MQELDKISSMLFDKIRGRFEKISLGDESGKSTSDPEFARFFNFDFTLNNKSFGNITISLIDNKNLKVYFNKDIAEKLSKEEQDEWYDFLKGLRRFAKQNILGFDTRDINRSSLELRDIMQQSKSDSAYNSNELKIQESKMYGTRTKSYDRVGETRLIVRHSSVVDEEKRGARTRNIESIFVENGEGERFKLPFTNLHGARAVGQHVAQGGVLSDDRTQEIYAMVEEMQQLGKFLRATRNSQAFEDTEVPRMVEAARDRYFEVRGALKTMRGPKGYSRFWENYVARNSASLEEAGDLRERFTKKFLDQRIEEALPFVYAAYEDRQSRLDKRSNLALEFEEWANKMISGEQQVNEGTWALPDNDQSVRKFKELMGKTLEFGADAESATNALYDIFGDDELFDELGSAADLQGPEADARPTIVLWFKDFYKEIVSQGFDGPSRTFIDEIASYLRNWKPEEKTEPESQPTEESVDEAYNDQPASSRDTSDENPLIVIYDDEFDKGRPSTSGHMNLTTFMNIHGISAKYQQELAQMVLDAGVGEQVEVPEQVLADYNAEYEKEGKPTRRVWIELSEHHSSESDDQSDDKAVNFSDLKKLAGI